MSESTATGPPPGDPREVANTVSDSGVAVRKAATIYGEDAVAVYVTIRSYRDQRCTVRVTDEIPAVLQGGEVEFHPHYDPDNWTHGDGVVVYSTIIRPGVSRTTVYGVTIDDPSQLELFDFEPGMDVVEDDPPSSSAGAGAPAEEAETFDFGSPGGRRRDGEASSPEGASGADARSPRTDDPASEEADGSVVDQLVAELEDRELSPDERSALREALDIDARPAVGTRLRSLRREVDSLRQELATTERQAADIDRVESTVDELSGDLQERYRELSSDIESLEETLRHEVAWRSQLRQQLRFDTDEERPSDADGGDRDQTDGNRWGAAR